MSLNTTFKQKKGLFNMGVPKQEINTKLAGRKLLPLERFQKHFLLSFDFLFFFQIVFMWTAKDPMCLILSAQSRNSGWQGFSFNHMQSLTSPHVIVNLIQKRSLVRNSRLVDFMLILQKPSLFARVHFCQQKNQVLTCNYKTFVIVTR